MDYKELLKEFDMYLEVSMQSIADVRDRLIDDEEKAAVFILGQIYSCLESKRNDLEELIEEEKVNGRKD